MSKSYFDETNFAEKKDKDSYTESKIDAEKAVWEIYKEHKDDIEVVCLLPTMVVGRYLSK